MVCSKKGQYSKLIHVSYKTENPKNSRFLFYKLAFNAIFVSFSKQEINGFTPPNFILAFFTVFLSGIHITASHMSVLYFSITFTNYYGASLAPDFSFSYFLLSIAKNKNRSNTICSGVFVGEKIFAPE